VASDADDGSIDKIAAAIANGPSKAARKKTRKSTKSRRADVNKLNIEATDKNSAPPSGVGSVVPAAGEGALAAVVSTPQKLQGSKRKVESDVDSAPASTSKRNKKAKTLVPTGVSSAWAEGLTPASLADARRDIKNAKSRTAGRLSTPRTPTLKTSIHQPASTPHLQASTPPPTTAAMLVSPTSSELDRNYPLLPVIKTKPFSYRSFDRATIEALAILAQRHGDALALQIEGPEAVPDVSEAQPKPDLEEPGSVNYGGCISDDDDDDEVERGGMSDSEDIKMDGQRTTGNTMVGVVISDENPPAPAPAPVTRTTRTTPSGKTKFTLKDLPDNVDPHTFKNVFMARLVAYIGVSLDPWVVKHNPKWPKIYAFPGTPLPTFAPGHAVWELSRQWVCTWRHNLATSAIQTIEEIADAKGFAAIPDALPEVQAVQACNRAEFIKGLVAEGLGPHRPFQSIAIRISPDQNKAIHVGRFQSVLVAKTFAHHLLAIGDPRGTSMTKEIGYPVGALGLSTAAVELALTLYRTGTFVHDGLKKADHFSHEMWGGRTQVYIQDAQKIVDSRWPSVMEIFGQREESSGDESAPDDLMEGSDLEDQDM
ncbi:hypothetical protein EUX98_g8958, partial [Antrodiella citrinella]